MKPLPLIQRRAAASAAIAGLENAAATAYHRQYGMVQQMRLTPALRRRDAAAIQGSAQARLAALEAIIGRLIEITFIATFTQRFFAR